MKFKSYLAALSLCLLPLVSQAGVSYQWRPLNHETPKGITLQLEFDESTIDSGAFRLVIDEGYYLEDERPATGLLGLRYAFPGVSDAMDYSPDEEFGHGFGLLDIDLQFDEDGFLSGYIHANDSHHHFTMASAGRTFTVLDANSDEGMPWAECGWTVGVDCIGASGQIERLQRIRRAEIPEPGSFALLGIGLLAAAGLRRKAARQLTLP